MNSRTTRAPRTALSTSLAALLVLALAGCRQAPQSGNREQAGGTSTGKESRDGGFFTPKKELAAGTAFSARLDESVSSETASVGDRVTASVVNDVTTDGSVVIHAGAKATGRVSEVKPAKHFGGQAMVSVTFDSVDVSGLKGLPIEGSLSSHANKSTGTDTATIAGSTVGGAVLGKVIGGDDKDAAVGAVVGGGIGTAVASRKSEEAVIEAGTIVSVRTTSSAKL